MQKYLYEGDTFMQMFIVRNHVMVATKNVYKLTNIKFIISGNEF